MNSFFKNSIRRYFYKEIVTQRLNKIVQGHTVSGTAENGTQVFLVPQLILLMPRCTTSLAPINAVRILEVPRSELDLVKERVTVDFLNNKSLMEPRLVIQKKLMRFLSILF